ncbi:unnamed protein product [Dicrocoelium dendriticum]|nr:unnamed protein product [Dicrocoelium dendriticum]
MDRGRTKTAVDKFRAYIDYCKLSEDPGPCRVFFRRYRYDSDQQKCVEFTYGGCRGNRNNFRSVSDCQKECAGN